MPRPLKFACVSWRGVAKNRLHDFEAGASSHRTKRPE